MTDICFYDSEYKKYGKYSCTALFQQVAYFDDHQNCIDYFEPFYHFDYFERLNSSDFRELNSSDSAISNIEFSSTSLCSPYSNNDKYPTHALLQCVVNDVAETTDDYFVSNTSLTILHRMGLIDFYISTTDYGHSLWDKNCNDWFYDVYGVDYDEGYIGEWNLFYLAVDGDIYFYDDIYGVFPFCGLNVHRGLYELYNGTEYLGIVNTGQNLTGTIPQSVCYLYDRLLLFQIVDARSLRGALPSCMGSHLYLLHYLLIMNTSLSGNIPNGIGQYGYLGSVAFHDNPLMVSTFPQSLCKVLTNPSVYFRVISFMRTPLYGTIPDCLFDAEELIKPNNMNITIAPQARQLSLFHTNLNGTIPRSLCNVTEERFLMLQFVGNPYIYGTIPDCLNSWAIEFRYMDGLSGTVPESVFCHENLVGILIENMTNLDASTVPQCFSSTKPMLQVLILYNSSFIGEFPPFPANNSLLWINLANNQFEGSLSNIIPDDIPLIQNFIVNDNNFHDDDISDLLQYLFEETNITVLSIADNPNIHGTIPENVDDLSLNIFLAHNCDLHGTIPSNTNFEALTKITLFGNRISGHLPTSNIYPNSSLTIVLLGNLFFTESELPEWINSPFATAANLYISQYQQNMSIFLLIIAYLGVFILIVGIIRDIIDRIKNKNKIVTRDEFGFFANVEFIHDKFQDWKLLLSLTVLIIFYAVNANYFFMVTAESWFALSWYHVQRDHNKWINWILLLFAILIQVIICKVILDLNLEQINMKHSKTLKKMSYSAESNEANLETNTVVDAQMKSLEMIKKQKRAKYCHVTLIIVYSLLYLAGIGIVILYLIASSLPEQNVLNLMQSEAILITQSIGLVLFVNNRYIIRGLINIIAKKNDFVYFYRSEFVLLLRILNTIIIPLIASIFILNDCGRYWVTFWDYCNDNDLKSEFDSHILVDYRCGEEIKCEIKDEFQILSANDVCSSPSISGFNVNRCIRSFFYHWSFVIMMKLIFTIFASIIGLFVRLLRLKTSKRNKLYVEGFHTSMITNLLISIIFLFISPLILPLNIIQISLRAYLYKLMITKFGLKLSTINTRNVKEHKTKQSLPIYFLWIGVIIGQILVTLFLIFCVGNIAISVLFIICILSIGIYARIMIRKNKKEFVITKLEHSKSMTLERMKTPSNNTRKAFSPSMSPLSDFKPRKNSLIELGDLNLNDTKEDVEEIKVEEGILEITTGPDTKETNNGQRASIVEVVDNDGNGNAEATGTVTGTVINGETQQNEMNVLGTNGTTGDGEENITRKRRATVPVPVDEDEESVSFHD